MNPIPELCFLFNFLNFLPFSGFKSHLSYTLILPVSQLQTQQMMTSQIINTNL